MKLRVINSGSVGNCYLLEGRNSTLILELGVPFSQIKKALNFDFSKVAGVLVSHEHLDHARAIKDAAKAGLNIYSGAGTIKVSGVNSHRLFAIESKKKYQIGEFLVMPFDIVHVNSDGTPCAEPFGFLINHEECGNVLFITDTAYSPYTFNNLNNVIIEANYSQELIEQRLYEGKLLGFLKERIVRSHMSIETCLKMLKANDLTNVNNIVLIHLSDSNSDAKNFKSVVTLQTGKNTHIAEPGLLINFDRTPF